MNGFAYLTDETLERRIERLQQLADSSDELEQYVLLMGKQEEAATELARRRTGGQS